MSEEEPNPWAGTIPLDRRARVSAPRRSWTGWGMVLLRNAVIAAVLAVLVIIPFPSGILDMLSDGGAWGQLLRPATGAPQLALAAWILLSGRVVIGFFTGGTPVRGRPGRAAARRRAAEGERSLDRAAMVHIPAEPVRELGGVHRWKLAESLGIDWRGDLLTDDDLWAREVAQAARSRAEAARRRP